MPKILLILVAGYLLGSIPFGYLLVRIFRGEDVRRSGSGNIGATNVSRKSPVLGLLTLLLDGLKGAAAVLVARFLAGRTGIDEYLVMSIAALCAVAGHMFPVWLSFRGGKGVATALGAFLMVAPKAVLLAAAIFFVVVLLFRYVSLGSILAVAAFPALAWLLREFGSTRTALILMCATSLLIVARHHQNIRRLLAHTEPRFGAKQA